MDINELLDKLSEGIGKDPLVSNFSESNYSRLHKVYVNVDDRQWPEMEDTPYVVIFPDFKVVGQLQTYKYHSIICICCIYDDERDEHPTLENVSKYSGVYKLEQFRKHIEQAISAIDIGNAVIDEIEIDYDVISNFPFHFVSMEISFSELIPLGTDNLQ